MRGCVKKVFAFGTPLVMTVIVVLWLFSDRAISPYIIIGSASMNGGIWRKIRFVIPLSTEIKAVILQA